MTIFGNCRGGRGGRPFAPPEFPDPPLLTTSGLSITDIENAVNSDLENLRNWLIAKKRSLNVTKTEFMLIGSPQMIKSTSSSQPNILIESKQIQQVNQSKALGYINNTIYYI